MCVSINGGGKSASTREGAITTAGRNGTQPSPKSTAALGQAYIIHMTWGTLNILYFGRFLKLLSKLGVASNVSDHF